jgi:hypothetical protein
MKDDFLQWFALNYSALAKKRKTLDYDVFMETAEKINEMEARLFGQIRCREAYFWRAYDNGVKSKRKADRSADLPEIATPCEVDPPQKIEIIQERPRKDSPLLQYEVFLQLGMSARAFARAFGYKEKTTVKAFGRFKSRILEKNKIQKGAKSETITLRV